jgi:hypothetical protein
MFFAEELLKFDGITVDNYQIEPDKITLRLGYFKDKSSRVIASYLLQKIQTKREKYNVKKK